MRARALLTTIGMMLALPASAFGQEQGGGPSPESQRAQSSQSPSGSTAQAGGAEYGAQDIARTQTVPGTQAVLLPTGYAAAPDLAPEPVKQAIWAANRIVGKPYLYGGGHNRRFRSRGYDCSGTVSFALHGGGLLESPLDSRRFMGWGARGRGQWITVYTNPGHAFAVIAGLRLDTSAAGDPSGLKGPRWRPTLRKTRGYRVRHVEGL